MAAAAGPSPSSLGLSPASSPKKEYSAEEKRVCSIEAMKRGGAILSSILRELREKCVAGVGTAELDALGATLTGRLDALKREQGMAISVLENRMNAFERAPAADGSLPQTAIDAFQADIAALREEVAAQQSRIEDSAATAAAQIEQTRATAEALEQSAVQSTRAATVRVALASIQAALESGAPYDLDLPELQSAIGQSLDPALTGPAVDGVPTLAALQKEYPKSARAALATARREGVRTRAPVARLAALNGAPSRHTDPPTITRTSDDSPPFSSNSTAVRTFDGDSLLDTSKHATMRHR